MDISRDHSEYKNSYTVTGTYDEMLTIASVFKSFDPRAWPFHAAANLSTTHEAPLVQVTDLSEKRLKLIAVKLEQLSDGSQPVAVAIRKTLDDPGLIYRPEI